MNHASVFEYTTGEDENDYVCPMETIGEDGRVKMDQLDDCVEVDVVERYSGNIKIANKQAARRPGDISRGA